MKVSQFIEVFHSGKMVANPEAWKNGTVKLNTIMVLISGLLAILNMFDCSVCNLQLTSEQVIGISTGIMTIAGIFNAGSTLATSDKVGFKPKPKIEVDVDLNNDIENLQ